MKMLTRTISVVAVAAALVLGGTHLVHAQSTNSNSQQEEQERAEEQQREAQKKAEEQRLEAQKKEAERLREAAKQAAERRREEAKQRAESMHATEVEDESGDNERNGVSVVAELRKKLREHTQEERKSNCEERKVGLVQKLENLKKNAASYKSKVDEVFSAAEAYATDKNLSSDTLDTQLAAADSAQTAAKVQVDALTVLTVTINCDDPDVAAQIATFKVAAEKARTSLHAYKTAVKAVLETVRTLAEAA